MVQWAKAHDSKFGDSSSVPRRSIGGRRELLCRLSSGPHTGSPDIPGFLRGSNERTKGAQLSVLAQGARALKELRFWFTEPEPEPDFPPPPDTDVISLKATVLRL